MSPTALVAAAAESVLVDLPDAPAEDVTEPDLLEGMLIEEVSIDGMCGVY
jgi:mycofactocin precursor